MNAALEPIKPDEHWTHIVVTKFQPVCLGATDNDASSRLSRFMPAFSIHSCVAQQMPGAGNASLRKRLCFLELLDCSVRRAGTDEIDALTEFGSGLVMIVSLFGWTTGHVPRPLRWLSRCDPLLYWGLWRPLELRGAGGHGGST